MILLCANDALDSGACTRGEVRVGRGVFVDLPALLPSGALSDTSSGPSFPVVIVVSLMTRQQPCLETS